MKLVILKENLKNIVKAVERIIGRNLSLPILNNFLLTASGNFLEITGTDLEIAIRAWALAKIEKEGKTVVPGHFFSQLINLLPKEKVNFTVQNKFLVIESGNYCSQIKTFDPEDFPLIPKIENTSPLKINNQPFISGLSQVVDFASAESIRPEISGVLLICQKDLIKLASTDSFRLAEKKLFFEEERDQNEEISLIIPQKTTRELINVFSEKKGKVNLYFSPNQILFELPMEETNHPQFQIISRLIEGKYPDYQNYIPTKYETQAVISRAEFIIKLKTAGLFSGKTNEVKLNIDPKKEGLEISAQSQELGKNQSFLPGKIKGKKKEISFNWKFLTDGLSQIKSQEIIFELAEQEGPAILKPLDDSSYFYIVMPLKRS